MSAQVTVVGPTHPYKGGIAQHTTTMARRLHEAGVPTEIVSWSHQYPRALYPGEMHVPDGRPEVPEHSDVRAPLAWFAPWSWWRTARSLRTRRAVVFAIVNPLQAIAYLAMIPTLRRAGVRVIAQFHNVVPHERSAMDARITSALLTRVDAALAHTEVEAEAAREMGAKECAVSPLPPSLPASRPADRQVRSDAETPLRVLSFGLVREYKGVDLLMRAVAQVPLAELAVVGEFWDGVEQYSDLARELGIADRVSLHPGYVSSDEVAAHFARADVAAFAYRSATSSGAVLLALDSGVPALVTDVGSLAAAVGDGRYGLAAPPEDVDAFAQLLRDASNPEQLALWDEALEQRQSSGELMWQAYTDLLVRLTSAQA